MANQREILFPDKFYHIYNHAVAKEILFKTKSDYILYLNKYETFASPYFDIYAYCLMPNHFHFLLKVKSVQELFSLGYNENDNIHKFLSQKMGTLFNSYTRSYNLNYKRKGSLFYESFQRIAIHTEPYLYKLVVYIHLNPVKHGFVEKPEEWNYSSFKNIYHNTKSKKEYHEVINWFSDKENYLFCHRIESDLDDKYKLEM